MNWSTGRMKIKENHSQGKRWRVTITADWMPAQQHVTLAMDDPEKLYGDIMPDLQQSDLRITNVEAVLGDKGAPIYKGGPNLRVNEQTVASLTAVPFDVACLANNHTLDYGSEGLAETIRILEKSGIRTVGAGLSGAEAEKPLLTEVKGNPIAILNCAEGEACRSINGSAGAYGIDLLRLQQQISELKAQQMVVIVIFHGGREFSPMPPPYVVNDLRNIANMGADAVIGHHPHVPQGIELYEGVPIVYSQGNFAFLFENPAFYLHAGYVVHLDFCGRTLVGLEITPYHITEKGLRKMDERTRTQFNADMEEVSQRLKVWSDIEHAWEAFVDHYGEKSIVSRFASGIKAFKEKDKKKLATSANLFFTSAHRELFINGLKRAAYGRLGDSPQWAKQLVKHWLTFSFS